MGKLMPDQKSAVRNYSFATFLLGSMFIVLKLVEWSHLVAEGFSIGVQPAEGVIDYTGQVLHLLHLNRRSRCSRVRWPVGHALPDLQG